MAVTSRIWTSPIHSTAAHSMSSVKNILFLGHCKSFFYPNVSARSSCPIVDKASVDSHGGSRSTHQTYKSTPPSRPSSTLPGDENTIRSPLKVIPCRCPHSHNSPHKLKTVIEIDSPTYRRTSPNNSIDKIYTESLGTPPSYKNDSQGDFQAERDWMAYNILAEQDRARKEEKDVKQRGGADELELPFIKDEDFLYYPPTRNPLKAGERERKAIESKAQRKRLVKKRGEVFKLQKAVSKIVKKLSSRHQR